MVRTPEKVFEDATVRTFVFVLRNSTTRHETQTSKVLIRDMTKGGKTQDSASVDQSIMEKSHLANLLLHSQDAAPAIFAKCTQGSMTVGEAFEFFYGFKTADDEQFLATDRPSNTYEPFVRSAAINRYGHLRPVEFVDYRPDVMRANRKTARPGDRQRFERPKVIVARMGRLLLATFDPTGVFVKDAMLLASPMNSADHLKVLTGLLNSRVLQYLYENYFATIDVLKNALLALPIPPIPAEIEDNTSYSRIVELVERMRTLHKKRTEAKIERERTVIQHQIDATDRQIDRLVYELYDLTDEEIAVVEESAIP
jgi:hypothetical protein